MKQNKKPIHILIYGNAGVGKSILASTFPKCLYLDFDNGTNHYEKHFKDNKYLRGENLITYLQKAIGQIEKGTFEYETIVIDSLTNLENTAISQFKKLDINNWSQNLYQSNQKKLQYDDWGNISGSTISLLSYMRTLPINIVIITQIDKAKVDGTLKNFPMLVGKGQLESLHFADIVGYLYSVNPEKPQRYLAISSTEEDNYYAKIRNLSAVKDPIKNPNFDKISKLLNDENINLNFED